MIIQNGTAAIYREEIIPDPRFQTRKKVRGEEIHRGACQWRPLQNDLHTPTPPTSRETATIEILIPYTPAIPHSQSIAVEITPSTEQGTITATITQVEHLHLVKITRLTATLTSR